MKKFLSIISNPIVVTLLVLIADQWLKIWVKTDMYLSQEFPLFGEWFLIHFTENKGMAFGWEIPFLSPEAAKLFLSIFRIVAIIGIGYYLFKVLPKNAHKGLKICVALIFAGAIGNIIDSTFYGIIFNESFNQIATFMPDEGGYSSFLQGWVVDMFHFNVFWPKWVPYVGGNAVFPPVFNIADMSISFGIGIVFVFNKAFFKHNNVVLSD